MFLGKKKTEPEVQVVTYAEGKTFPLNRIKRGDGCVFEYISMGPAVLIYYTNPTGAEIKMIKNAELDIGFFSAECLLYFIIKFGGNIVECPFNANLCSNKQALQKMGTQRNLTIFLIDADTNIVKAMRLVQMPSQFSEALCYMVNEQLSSPFDERVYNYLVDLVEKDYSVSQLSEFVQVSMHVTQ